MVDANVKDEAQKSAFNPGKDEAQLNSLNAMEEEEDDDDEDEYEYEYEYDEEEEEEEKEEEEDDEEEEPAEEKIKKENAVKEDGKNGREPESEEKLGENLKKDKRSSSRNRKKSDSGTLAVNGDNPESSNRKKASKRVASMGMVFMCSSKTKTDCFRYKILGLPESKKDQVLKIYRGMRLFLFDVDLRLMYGIFKAAGPGGYNIEPKAFKSEFPSQVRFTVLDDCLPLAEEKFKSVLKENYYSRNKFEGLLKSEQVKKLCKLFVASGTRSKSRRTRPIETRRDESHRNDRRAQEKRKRQARDEDRRPHSPAREKRRYTDYDHPPVLYDREPPVPRYHRPQPTAMRSPVRLYTYERYVRDRVPPEPHTYRVFDRERDPYLAYNSREPPLYHDAVYAVPPRDYHLVSREYNHPSASEYRRVPNYREVEIAGDYRAAAPNYRSLTHYKY